MKYDQKIILKNGDEAWLRNGDASDGDAVYGIFNLTHAETDYLLSYPDENSFDPEQEAQFLEEKTNRHRAEFGISVLKEYWGLGLGKALTRACIECAGEAGYVQLELNVVADNKRAVTMYQDLGFTEFGRNPRGFHSRMSGYQEVVYMLLTL